MTDETMQEQLRQAIAALLPEWRPEGESAVPHATTLTTAGRRVAERQNIHHRLMHRDAQLGGAVVWGMRQRGMSWRAIYDATGIVQRTASRWLELFVAEGVAERTPGELDTRWQEPAREVNGDA